MREKKRKKINFEITQELSNYFRNFKSTICLFRNLITLINYTLKYHHRVVHIELTTLSFIFIRAGMQVQSRSQEILHERSNGFIFLLTLPAILWCMLTKDSHS